MAGPWGLGEAVQNSADVLREQDADLRWLLDALAATLETMLPEQVNVERELLRRRVRTLTVALAGHHFECRALPSGGLETVHATVRRGIVGRRQQLPVETWVRRLEQALDEAGRRADDDRSALARLMR